jgi:DnaJ-domain-containing protein 1
VVEEVAMDPLFERFERLVRSMFQGDEDRFREDPFGGSSSGERHRGGRDYIFDEKSDRDFRDAWEELDEYLRGGSSGSSDGPFEHADGSSRFDSTGFGPSGFGERVRDRTHDRSRTERTGRSRSRPLPPNELRKDYELLGVSFGAPFEEVRKAYRSLIRTHHPDVHGRDKGATDRATSRSQEINESFQRIKMWVEGRRND